MKKTKWLFLFLFVCVMCLASCAIDSSDIGLNVTVASDMTATATVTITDIDLTQARYCGHLDSVTVFYAYTDEKKQSLGDFKNITGVDGASAPTDANADGKAVAEITDRENQTFLASGNNYWKKKLEFQLPQEAAGKSVSFLVMLQGTDYDDENDLAPITSFLTSAVFTFVAAPPVYTVTIPATVSLGQTAEVSVDQGENLAPGQYVCVSLEGDSQGKFSLSRAEDRLEYLISARYPEDNRNYPVSDQDVIAFGRSDDQQADSLADITFHEPETEAKYAGDYYGSVTFVVSVEEEPGLTMSRPSLFLAPGQTKKLFAYSDTLREGSLTWSSADEAVAKVSQDGTVEAVSGGKTIVSAVSTTGRTVRCSVTVGGKVDVSGLTGAYRAKDGDILFGKGNADTHITIADGATVTLENCDLTALKNDASHPWAGITLEGDATLIFMGANRVKGGYGNAPGIYVPPGKTLTIQKKDIGMFSTAYSFLEAYGSENGAGIGGGAGLGCGSILIDCGNTIGGTRGAVIAYGGAGCAGIGSGKGASCGNITVISGKVTAKGGEKAAGIGSGRSYSTCGDITINGLFEESCVVTAAGGENGAGIGSGYVHSTCGDIAISGGNVTADGGENAAGIGSGGYSVCGAVTIENGTVTTWGGSGAPGIGAGSYEGICDEVVISGGKVTATGGAEGTYYRCITIENSTVTATGGEKAAGIGGGFGSGAEIIGENIIDGSITISGGKVTATGGDYGAGIGSGSGTEDAPSTCRNILISGGTVKATGGNSAASIGCGYSYSICGDISIKDTVTEVTVDEIGLCDGQTCGTVTIDHNANVIYN